VPGRPSRLPGGVRPDSDEAAVALVTSGRQVLVDGYNITRQHHDRHPLEQQRDWLLSEAAAVASRTAARIVLVFDSKEDAAGVPPRRRPGVQLRFSGGGSADDDLVAIVAGLPADQPVVVVTDDRGLRHRLQALDADVVPTSAFLRLARGGR
jgi:predicted RNA-binding protein with PIN domain